MTVHHIGIAVASLERSLRFYRDWLGLEVLYEVHIDAAYLSDLLAYDGLALQVAMLRLPAPDLRLELLEYQGVERAEVDHRHGNPGITHLALQVPDVEATYRRLTGFGVKAVSEPVTPTAGPNQGGRLVYLIDPDGVRIELMQK